MKRFSRESSRIRLFVWLVAFTPLFAIGDLAACHGQQSSAPPTLENLLQDEAVAPVQRPVAVASGDPTETVDQHAGRFQGDLVRPKGGVQHPDLDNAWAEYDAAGAKVAESIRAAIAKQFDDTAAKGDLDSAEKWQAALKKFEKTGEVPSEIEKKIATSTALTDYKKAKDTLAKAYENVVKALTTDKKIAEARAARAESLSLARGDITPRVRVLRNRWFLVEMQPLAFKSGTHEGHYSLNGRIPVDNFGKVDHGPIRLNGKEKPKSFCVIAPTGSFSQLVFEVPTASNEFRAEAAMADTSVGQKTPVTFQVVAANGDVLWSSKPLGRAGQSQTCRVSVKDQKTITLKVECPGDWFNAHSIWVAPQFVK